MSTPATVSTLVVLLSYQLALVLDRPTHQEPSGDDSEPVVTDQPDATDKEFRACVYLARKRANDDVRAERREETNYENAI